MLPTQILAVAGMIVAVLTGYPQLISAIGKPQAMFKFNVFSLVAYGVAIGVAAGYGLIAVCIAAVSVYILRLVIVYRVAAQAQFRSSRA